MSEKFIAGEIVENPNEPGANKYHAAIMDCNGICKPLSWQDIAATLAGFLRRSGIRVDGACIDADGWGLFWIGEKPYPEEKWWVLDDSVSNPIDDSAIYRFFVGPQPNWKDCLIEFPPEVEGS